MIVALAALMLQAGGQSAPPAINDTVTVPGASTRLFLELRGRADASPIVLYLHGGPGQAIGLVAFRAYVGPALESNALVAYLHQRGVMRSASVPDSALTIANHVHDVLNTMEYLTRRFPGRPVYLLGHSWGGILATYVALEHPRNLAGIVLVSAPFDMALNLRASYDQTLAWEKGAGKDSAVRALTALGPPPYANPVEQVAQLSNWASNGNGGIAGRLDPAIAFGRAPFLAFDPAWIPAQLTITRAMVNELVQAKTTDRVAGLHLPLLLLAGSRDLVTPASALRVGYGLWGGPKSFVELTDSHHLPFVDEPVRFATLVSAFIQGKNVQ